MGLKTGPICHMFDDAMFPEARGEEKEWQVLDATGRVRHLPHPVFQMRVFNPQTGKYDYVETRLEGAPKENELEHFWQQTLSELRSATASEAGPDFIDDCFQLDVNS